MKKKIKLLKQTVTCPQIDSDCTPGTEAGTITDSGNQNKDNADAFAHQMKPILLSLADKEKKSTRQLAAGLTEMGVNTFRGGKWDPTTVNRLIKRLGPDFEAELKQRAKDARANRYKSYEAAQGSQQ